jgi:hypothetical protein
VNEEPRREAIQTANSEPKSGSKALKRLAIASPFVVSTIAVAISLLAYLDQHVANESAQISAEQAYAANSSFWLVYRPPPPMKLSKQDKVDLRAIQNAIKEFDKALASESKPRTAIITGPLLSSSTGVLVLNENTSVEVVIENRNSTPITDVDLIIDAQEGVGQVLSSESIGVGTVPPCSTATVNTISQATSDLNDKLVMNMALHGAKYGEVTIGVESMVFTDSNGVRWVRSQNGGFTRYSGQISSPTSIEYPAGNDITTAAGCLLRPTLGAAW